MKKLFYIYCDEEEEMERETSKQEYIYQEPTRDKEEMNMIISCNALVGIMTPKTLNTKQIYKEEKTNSVG